MLLFLSFIKYVAFDCHIFVSILSILPKTDLKNSYPLPSHAHSFLSSTQGKKFIQVLGFESIKYQATGCP